jgi:hypothetical protein
MLRFLGILLIILLYLYSELTLPLPYSKNKSTTECTTKGVITPFAYGVLFFVGPLTPSPSKLNKSSLSGTVSENSIYHTGIEILLILSTSLATTPGNTKIGSWCCAVARWVLRSKIRGVRA